MNFIGLLRTLEQITRPPRMGHDDDRPLPDYEPVSPDGYYGYAEPNLAERSPHPVPREQRIGTYCEDYEVTGCSVDGCPIGCYHAHPAEPALTPDELVGVRRLLSDYSALINLQTSASNHTGTGAESAPSPTIVQSAPPPTVDGEGPASVRDIQPSPEVGRPTSELLTEAAELILVCKTGQIPLVWLALVDELRDRAATFKAIEE